VNKYETFELTSTQSFDNEIWSSIKTGHLVQHKLNKKQKIEFSKLKEYSEYLMNKKFTDIKTGLDRIRKSINGYIIYRFSSQNRYQVNLNLTTNKIELKRSI